ncbi:MAG: hypothetical protein JST26_08655 [Bacteroidetes bacterium]|nr:hypothetical protein [Bacteroidota bacterium]
MSGNFFSNTREGLSQEERWLDTLSPDYMKIDSREIPDFVKFAYELSRHIHYYNSQNVAEGTWEDFFTTDANIYAILISRFDLMGVAYEFGQKRMAVINSESDEEAFENLRQMIGFLDRIISRLLSIRQVFRNTNNYADVEMITAILNNLEDEAITLEAFTNEANRTFSTGEPIRISFTYEKAEDLAAAVSPIFSGQHPAVEVIPTAIPSFIAIFDSLQAKYTRLAQSCTSYVNEEQFTEKQYSPQMGLFIAFLELYGHLRKQINGITKRHLDFYYKDLLGITRLDDQPDTVHLIIEPEPHAHPVTLSPDQLLMAEVKGKENPAYYRIENKQTLSSATIKDLKAVFVSDYPQIISPKRTFWDVNEAQVYKAQLPVLKPGDYLKKKGDLTSWPVMGEDQHGLADSERTMDDAEPGFALASPLFYQADGERSFRIGLHVKSAGIPTLAEYIRNFSGVTGKSRETIVHELFSSAFTLQFSGTEGWEEIKKYNVSARHTDSLVSELEISFTLTASDKIFDLYKEEIHGLTINTNLPVLQVRINNFVEHCPYGFLRSLLLDRVTIHVDVKGFKALKLQNNVGPLSPVAPFQPFGPQPSVGSFLDIKNTNVFNRYLKKFLINIEWLELPRGKGGFMTHYDGYGRSYNNDSFEINISSLNRGIYKPAFDQRQKFPLFASDSDSGELSAFSVIGGVDFRKIDFQSNAQLSDEAEVGDFMFREGAIRLELCSPSDAFGHKLFPQVFPEVILNNARKFRRKLPLPNQPYIPVIKTIEVDFEAEYSENFKEENTTDTNLQIFHLYPFGYQAVFPGVEKKNYFLLPQFPDSCNLYIGLENAEENTELSLLFQIEDSSFQHTLHEPEEIKWSYLEANNWVEFKGHDIISDTTGHFINSGIVRLRLPRQISTNNTILPSGAFWIRVSAEGVATLQTRALIVAVNGVTATRTRKPGQPELPVYRLMPQSIREFERHVKGIQNIWQLFPSFGGKSSESEEKYYVRVSERLRHKGRPKQIRDIIQVILEEFPQIHIVKCFNVENEDFKILPGIDLQIILIPKETNEDGFINEQPKVSLSVLYQVKSFISQLVSPFIRIEIGNAVYEKVKVFCKVVFNSEYGQDYGILKRQFIADINSYISPWLFGSAEEIKLGNRLYKAELLMYLKMKPYVKYITGFSLVHFSSYRDESSDDDIATSTDSAVGRVEFIEGSSPASVLIPSSFHNISVIDEAEYEEPKPAGIGDFFIGEEFHVNADMPSETHKHVHNPDDELFSLIITHNME